MAYVDATYQTTFQVTEVGNIDAPVSIGTLTASATQTYVGTAGKKVNGTFQFPVFKSPARILGIRVYCPATAIASGDTMTLGFMNGTTNFGTCTAVPAVNTYVDAVLVPVTVASNGAETGGILFAANSEITMSNVAIGTASADALGSYAIDVIFRNLFTT